MSDFSQFVPEHVRRLPNCRFQKLFPSSHGMTRPIALNLNENPFGPSPLALEAIQASLAEMHRYPEADPSALERDLANFHAVDREEVMVTAGVTELLAIVAQGFLAVGRNAVTSACSFMVYKIATQASGGRLTEVRTRDYGYDLDAIAEAIDENTRVVFIANPNNPTGSLLKADTFTRFLDGLPNHVLPVLDEAYFDFADAFAKQRGVGYSNSLELVRDKRCVLVLRTFSKAHGLAGLRVGYGIGPKTVIRLLKPLRAIFSVSRPALAAAAAALSDREHIRRAVESNSQQAVVLATRMRQLGLVVPSTWANFLYCELGQDADFFAERLRSQGILVQPLAGCGAPTALRVSIGKPEENARFLEVLAAALGAPPEVEQKRTMNKR